MTVAPNATPKHPVEHAALAFARAAGGTVIHLGKGRWQVVGVTRPAVAPVFLRGQLAARPRVGAIYNAKARTADFWFKGMEHAGTEAGAVHPVHAAPPHAAHPNHASEAAPAHAPQAEWSPNIDFGPFRLRMRPGARGKVLPLNKHTWLVFHVPGHHVAGVDGTEGTQETGEEVGVLPLILLAALLKKTKDLGLAKKNPPAPQKRSWFAVEPPALPAALEKVPEHIAAEISEWLDPETAADVGLEIGCPNCNGRCGKRA